MRYNEFLSAAVRQDAQANDRIHFFSRNFSTFAAYICYKLNLSPNQTTFIFLLVGFSSGVTLYFELALVAYVLWRLHIILDMADGTLARATKTFSQNAKGFDRTNHIVINTTILMAPIPSQSPVILINFLIVTFYLYYFFSRNFEKADGKVHNFSVGANVFKNAIGLEGYILTQSLLVVFDMTQFATTLALAYAVSFLCLYLLKLFKHISK